MKELIDKYRRNSLSPEELTTLREYVNSQTDEQLGAVIQDDWLNDEIDTTGVDEDVMMRIRQSIGDLAEEPVYQAKKVSIWHTVYRWMQVAALFILPVLLISLYLVYQDNLKLEAQTIEIATGFGERANITLPDGTKVALNEETVLSYSPKDFNTSQRHIAFEGEGYFQVAKNPQSPFSINTESMIVKVLGTEFNLKSRNRSDIDELYLEEGSVQFISKISAKEMILSPHQQLIHQKGNGSLTVRTLKDVTEATGWLRHELIFRNVPLNSVFKQLEDTYLVTIHFDNQKVLNDRFTGIMTSRDLGECLRILEETYHFKTMVKGNNIYIR